MQQARADAAEAVILAAAAVAAVPSLQQPIVQALDTHDRMHALPIASHIRNMTGKCWQPSELPSPLQAKA